MSEGWICPICGRGLAPWVAECPCHGTVTQGTQGTFVPSYKDQRVYTGDDPEFFNGSTTDGKGIRNE